MSIRQSLSAIWNAIIAVACTFVLAAGCSKPEPNAPTKDNNTQLIAALESGQSETAKRLIEQGADVNAKNDQGYTALMAASVSGKTEIVKLLLGKGAGVTSKDKEKGKTALQWAQSSRHDDVAQLLKQAGAKE